MNANEIFEAFAERFKCKYGYLPLGKDSREPRNAIEVLGDLASSFHEIERLQGKLSGFLGAWEISEHKECDCHLLRQAEAIFGEKS